VLVLQESHRLSPVFLHGLAISGRNLRAPVCSSHLCQSGGW
jgi:hypothetical protein